MVMTSYLQASGTAFATYDYVEMQSTNGGGEPPTPANGPSGAKIFSALIIPILLAVALGWLLRGLVQKNSR